MLQTIESINTAINNFVWGVPAMILILGVGLILGLKTKFMALGVASEYLGTSTMFLYGKLALIAAAIYLVVKAVDAIIVTYKEQQEQTKKLVDSLEETESKISEVNSKIKENQDLINEINEHPLDIVDKNTLSRLEDENEQLKIQRDVLREIEKDKKDALSGSTYKQLTKRMDVDTNGYSPAFGTGMTPAYSLIQNNMASEFDNALSKFNLSDNQNILDAYAAMYAIRGYREELKQLSKDRNNDKISVEEYSKKQESLNEQIKYYQQVLNGITAEFIEYKGYLNDSDAAQKLLIDDIDNLIKNYSAFKVETKNFNEIWKELPEEVKKELLEMGKEGTLTAKVLEEKFGDLVIKLNAINVAAQDAADKITNMANEPEDFIDSFNKGLINFFSFTLNVWAIVATNIGAFVIHDARFAKSAEDDFYCAFDISALVGIFDTQNKFAVFLFGVQK